MSYDGYGRPTPSVGGDQNHGVALRDVTIVSFTLALFMLVVRFSARVFIVKKTGVDDWIMALATAVAAVQTAFILKSVASGEGRHRVYLTPKQQLDSVKWNTLSQMPLVVSNCLLKISICFMIIRITNSRRLVQWMWALMAALVLINGACFVDLLAQCRPLEALWDYTIQNACWSHKVLTDLAWLQGVFSIFTDLVCTSLPVIILWNIRISFKQKLAICGLMGLGLCTTICSIVRMVIYGTTKSFKDSTFTATTLEIWSILEQNIGLIAANMPLMRAVHHFASEKTPKIYSSLKSLIGGGMHRSSRSGVSTGSYTETSKTPASNGTDMAASKNRRRQYVPIDEMDVQLQTLPLTKTVDYSVAPLDETKDSRRGDEWDAEQGLKDRL